MHARSFLVETYVPTPDPRTLLLYLSHLDRCGQMWGEPLGIKDTLLPFMTILRAGPDPKELIGKTPISIIQNN
jgi:hypothetical protein